MKDNVFKFVSKIFFLKNFMISGQFFIYLIFYRKKCSFDIGIERLK